MCPEPVRLARFSQCKDGGAGIGIGVGKKQSSVQHMIGIGIHIGSHKAGHNQLHMDIVLGHLRLQGLGEEGHELFAGGIDGQVGQGLQFRGGSQVHNGPLSTANHLGQDLAGEHGNGSHVDGEQVPQQILRHPIQGLGFVYHAHIVNCIDKRFFNYSTKYSTYFIIKVKVAHLAGQDQCQLLSAKSL